MAREFRDFAQMLEIQGGEEERLMREAMERAQAKTGDARQALLRSEDELIRGGMRGDDGPDQLSGVASYSDYLKAKRDAAAAWQAAAASNSVGRAVAGRVGLMDEAGRAGDALNAEETRRGAAGAGSVRSLRGSRADDRARREAEAAALTARQGEADTFNREFYGEIGRNLTDRTATNRFTGQSQDMQRLAQMWLTNSGEVEAETGKGDLVSVGGGVQALGPSSGTKTERIRSIAVGGRFGEQNDPRGSPAYKDPSKKQWWEP